MDVFLRKLRGVVATGLIWCPFWAALFAVLVSMIAIFLPIRGDVGPIRMITTIGWVGFVSGGLFGILMSFAESGKAIRSLSLGRAALWGILGSAVFPLLTDRADQVFWTCPFGAVVAMSLVAIARKAALREATQPTRHHNVFFTSVLMAIRDLVNPPRELVRE